MSTSTSMPSNSSEMDEGKFNTAIDVHQKALDDMVNVNSLFTMAVFVGLTFSGNLSLETRSQCKVPEDKARSLLVYEVISFASYLFSSLVAKALKMHLNTYLFRDFEMINKFWRKIIRISLLCLSAWASIFGCIFLTMSMVDVVEIRLGKMSCGHDSMRAAGGLIAIVALALIIYIPATMHAIILTAKLFDP